ncbi:MAG: hypothetical protein IT386_13365 [Deltaproteobacteria bacterium]|nr:hypothetical protein [Deltaproteobacteria bacterium]
MKLISVGNSKLKISQPKRWNRWPRPNARRRGTKVFSTSLPAVHACPGRSPLCESTCYATPLPRNAGYFRKDREMHERWQAIEADVNAVVESVEALPRDAWLRIHASGDFFEPWYVWQWFVALAMRPDVRAWVYTRSWAVPGFIDELERLRRLPNVQVFASVDRTMTAKPPAGWRRAFVVEHAEDAPASALVCPQQTRAMSDCVDCGFCPLGTAGDVAFLEH